MTAVGYRKAGSNKSCVVVTSILNVVLVRARLSGTTGISETVGRHSQARSNYGNRCSWHEASTSSIGGKGITTALPYRNREHERDGNARLTDTLNMAT